MHISGNESWLSLTELSQDENDVKISIQTISSCGDGKILATPRNLSLKPGIQAPGKNHSISARFVAVICDIDIGTVISWTRTGSHFIKLEWSLAGSGVFPGFTTRHTLIENGQDGDISLSGGLGFALKALEFTSTLDLDGSPFVQWPHFPQPRRNDFPGTSGRHQRPPKAVFFGSQPRPLYFEDLDEPPPHLEHDTGSLHPKLRHMPLSMSLPPDQVSVSTDCTGDSVDTPPLTMATTATTWLDDGMGFSGLLSTSPADFSEVYVPPLEHLGSCKTEESTLDHLARVDRRLQSETFGQRKRKAQAMYAHNGDTSGMVALASDYTNLSSGNSCSFWNPSETGRFQYIMDGFSGPG